MSEYINYRMEKPKVTGFCIESAYDLEHLLNLLRNGTLFLMGRIGNKHPYISYYIKDDGIWSKYEDENEDENIFIVSIHSAVMWNQTGELHVLHGVEFLTDNSVPAALRQMVPSIKRGFGM